MKRAKFGRMAALTLGDIVMLYAALLLALILRYGAGFSDQLFDVHLVPFTVIFAIWLTVFYVAGIYDLRRLQNGTGFWKTLSLAIVANAIISILFFYLIPFFGITPKTTLSLFIVLFAVLEFFWRRSFNRYAAQGIPPRKILLVMDGEPTQTIAATLKENPQFGYEVSATVTLENISEALGGAMAAGTDFIVVPLHVRNHDAYAKMLYGAMNAGIGVMDVPRFTEIILEKVPLGDIDESWIIGHNLDEPEFYDGLKRGFEFIFALALGILLLPLEILIALLVKLTSPGPVFFKQNRVGKNGKIFTLYKFRNMYNDKEKNPDADSSAPQWTEAKDRRVTPVGKFLRASHLDELGQLINIAKGEMSFIGPRPERPEFVALLEEKVPFYAARHLVLPGVTGWAQINYRYGASVDDAARKLEYDIYYIKNRSLILDIAILLKTLKSFFVNPHT